MASNPSRQGPCRLLLIEDDEDDVFLLERAIDCVRDNLKVEVEYEHVENGLEGLYLVSKDDLEFLANSESREARARGLNYFKYGDDQEMLRAIEEEKSALRQAA